MFNIITITFNTLSSIISFMNIISIIMNLISATTTEATFSIASGFAPPTCSIIKKNLA